jgi:hypothetical protein
VAISHGIALEGSMDGWFLLGEDSHGPHQLVIDGLVDLDDLVVALNQKIALECLSPS